MYRWNNDYNQGAQPRILKALEETNQTCFPGYGKDDLCQLASDEIKKALCNENVDVHFMSGGTQANYTVLASMLRPYEGIISADSAHINVHETGAVENTGHKILTVPEVDGKLTAATVRTEAEKFRSSEFKEHIVEPKVVFLSFPSEYGTVYTLGELREIRKVCDEYGLYLYMDGARLGYGLGASGNDVELCNIPEIADAFYIGGTKCGALFGEAVVIVNDGLKKNFRSYMKQNGGMLAKGWLLGLQFHELFKDGLYLESTRNADIQAARIQKAFEQKGIPLYYRNNTNQQFVLLTDEQKKKIGQMHIFEDEGKNGLGLTVARFCTSWSTKKDDVDVLVDDILGM